MYRYKPLSLIHFISNNALWFYEQTRYTMSEICIDSINRPDKKSIKIQLSSNGDASYYLNKHTYTVKYPLLDDISDIPDSIAIIPFVGTLQPVAWATNSQFKVPILDEKLNSNLRKVQMGYDTILPDVNIRDAPSIEVNNIIETRPPNGDVESGLLFSGGVDSTASYLGHFEEKPILIAIKDGRLNELKWNWREQYLNKLAQKHGNKVELIECDHNNWLDYSLLNYRFGHLTNRSFWAAGMYGLAYTALTAPLMYKYGAERLYQAGGFLSDKTFPTNQPFLIEPFSWSGMETKIDGVDQTRQEKISIISNNKVSDTVLIDTCTNDIPLSCCKCEKCFRTILGFIAEGQDPSNYGFDADFNMLDEFQQWVESGRIHLKYNSSVRVWEEIQQRMGTETLPHGYDRDNDFLPWFKKIDFGDFHRERNKMSLKNKIFLSIPSPANLFIYNLLRG